MNNSIKAKATTKTTRTTKATTPQTNPDDKLLQDVRDILTKWRAAGLPDKALVVAVEAMVVAIESIDDKAKAKKAARAAFNRVVRDTERATKPKAASRGK